MDSVWIPQSLFNEWWDAQEAAVFCGTIYIGEESFMVYDNDLKSMSTAEMDEISELMNTYNDPAVQYRMIDFSWNGENFEVRNKVIVPNISTLPL